SDIERVFEGESPDSLVGNTLILEHLHPTMRGQFLMAREYARCMRRHQLMAPAREWASGDTLSDDTLWNARPATAIDELCAKRRIATLTSSWPFDTPVRPGQDEHAQAAIGRIIEQMLNARSTWEQGHVEAASAYEKAGLTAEAEKEYR